MNNPDKQFARHAIFLNLTQCHVVDLGNAGGRTLALNDVILQLQDPLLGQILDDNRSPIDAVLRRLNKPLACKDDAIKAGIVISEWLKANPQGMYEDRDAGSLHWSQVLKGCNGKICESFFEAMQTYIFAQQDAHFRSFLGSGSRPSYCEVAFVQTAVAKNQLLDYLPQYVAQDVGGAAPDPSERLWELMQIDSLALPMFLAAGGRLDERRSYSASVSARYGLNLSLNALGLAWMSTSKKLEISYALMKYLQGNVPATMAFVEYGLDLDTVHLVQGEVQRTMREVVHAHCIHCPQAMPLFKMIGAKECGDLARSAALEIMQAGQE